MKTEINFITARDVSQMIGISPATLHSLCQKRAQGDTTASPKFYQIGKKRMFTSEDVNAWLQQKAK